MNCRLPAWPLVIVFVGLMTVCAQAQDRGRRGGPMAPVAPGPAARAADTRGLEERLDKLSDQLRALQEEIAALKKELTTRPAGQPPGLMRGRMPGLRGGPMGPMQRGLLGRRAAPAAREPGETWRFFEEWTRRLEEELRSLREGRLAPGELGERLRRLVRERLEQLERSARSRVQPPDARKPAAPDARPGEDQGRPQKPDAQPPEKPAPPSREKPQAQPGDRPEQRSREFRQTIRITEVDGVRTVDVEEPGRRIHIRRDREGIDMAITTTRDGKTTTRQLRVTDEQQLREESPEAHEIYQRYMQPRPAPRAGAR